MKKNEIKYLKQEIELQKEVSHPNVIRLYKVFEEPNQIHLLLEYAPYGSLFQYLQKMKKLNDAQITFIFKKVCEGMQSLHSLNILHRDIKPENIMIGLNFEPKIADFGFACRICPHDRRRTICGTRDYFSPELYSHLDQNLALDIWCLGILLFELCHNKIPFEFNGLNFDSSLNLLKYNKPKYIFNYQI